MDKKSLLPIIIAPLLLFLLFSSSLSAISATATPFGHELNKFPQTKKKSKLEWNKFQMKIGVRPPQERRGGN
ncbi:hypothetical protein O6P43_026677 [Quillaja saponaria]|uniref:Transmembrane protein n=1 Tax=Quillaja saponaria TaxID=32244 RepID=A0AAD7PCG0_QUISA|nr:hypothetical protein O6P43_026677 [Quillaja saponaria]